ncbi:2OG-Fe(II) oxygenase [Chitinophaga lutea]
MLSRVRTLDWERIARNLHASGYAVAENLLTPAECDELIAGYPQGAPYRKTIQMERYRFGEGQYKYFKYPLPSLIGAIRSNAYAPLAAVANEWMAALQTGLRYPEQYEDFLEKCRTHGQDKPAVLILQYGPGGFNTLHQDLYGEVFFPIQLVLFLNEPGQDYEGGEFVLTEQIPRAQSKATVLQPRRGDVLFFTTSFRPAKGSRGHYRVAMKHGVSPLRSGRRHTLGIIFHDAQT